MERSLYLAFEALDYVRKNIKPCNTRTRSLPGYATPRSNPAISERDIGEIRDRARRFGRVGGSKLLGRLDLGRLAISRGVGNCAEMACAAGFFLYYHRGYYAFDVVTICGQDHDLIVTGTTGPQQYPARFELWPPHLAICDAWADIACLGQDYPARWEERMRNWHRTGIHICSGGAWLDAMECRDVATYPVRSRL